MKVIFHCDCGPWLDMQLKSLAADGLYVEVCSEDDETRFHHLLQTCDILWHVLRPVTADHIDSAPQLKLIQKIGVGVNTIDIKAAKARSIPVCNMPGTNSQAVAEMTLGLMLSVLRKLSAFDRQLRETGHWRSPAVWQNDLGEIKGRTIGLVGFGAVPMILAPILSAMGARVLYCSRSPKSDQPYRQVSKAELLAESDIISLHLPETAETRHWLDADAIGQMKPGAVLINTARGGLVDESALVSALQSGKLAGAGLDVFAAEPVTGDSAVLQLSNVVLTPHVAWLTRDTLERSLAVAVDNARRLIAGEALAHRVA
ncbi:MAG TPA: hydroxyacid dehydrogenase [Gammaproteobacteria bacterium]|nr:hydroxyacid dehydrogenase [Gammaproteobacteria bacterium]